MLIKKYTREDMKAAFEAGEARIVWSELSSRQPEEPDFPEFMRCEYQDDPRNLYALVYEYVGDDETYSSTVRSESLEFAVKFANVWVASVLKGRQISRFEVTEVGA